ncbi:Kelch repeat-containing protein [Gaoshiqia sp. Z1-71]|uniref:Kelch repeat-containing protein n=1 Tax=Gaoshiqia hydrogeniformans TaxID=3290090 RepID=UPI003BF7E05F
MIRKNLFVHNWTIRAFKLGMAFSVLLSVASCGGNDDEDLVGNWARLGDFNGNPRAGAISGTIGNEAFIGTGYDGENYLVDFWKYDVSKDNWSQMAKFEGVGRRSAVAFTASGKLYVGTGYDGTSRLKDFWAYNPTDNTWTRIEDFGGTARRGAVAFSINNIGYVATGDDTNYLKDMWAYNPATDEWTESTSVGGSKRRDAVVFVINNKAYIAGGVNNGLYVSDFHSFDPETEIWSKLRNISDNTAEAFDDDYNMERTFAVAFAVNGKGYIATGGKGSPGTTTWEYDPLTDLWQEKTSLEGAARQEAVAFVLNDVAFVGLGRNSSYYFEDIWRFEPNAEQNDYDNDN